MNKSIAILSVVVLCACTAEPIKTTDLSILPSNSFAATNNHASATSTVNADAEGLIPRIGRYLKQGVASWYGPQFHGKKTASGEIYDMFAMTAAHNTLPISSYARVTNLENQRSVVVRINDRGPFNGKRVMDLSYAAAKKLNLHETGSASVEIKAITPELALAQMHNQADHQAQAVYLQVGLFGNKKKAQSLQNKIAAHHLPQPKILPSTHKGSTLYKVQMGPIKSPAGVHQLNMQLAKLGIATQFMTENDQKQIAMIQ